MKISRLDFLVGTFGIAAVGLTGVACGTDRPDPLPPPPPDPDGGEVPSESCVDNGTSIAIGNNHGHTLVVSKEDVAAGVEKSYDIRGTSSHPHTVVLTTAHFASLAANIPITVASSEDNSHVHDVTVSCL